MTILVTVLGSQTDSWAHVAKLIKQGGFDEVVLITNDFAKDKLTPDSDTSLVVVDFNQPIHILLDTFLKELRPILKGTEVALNMVGGTGSVHMALLSSLLKLGLGIRLVVASDNQSFDEL